jgi:hypothetical protein
VTDLRAVWLCFITRKLQSVELMCKHSNEMVEGGGTVLSSRIDA